MSETETTPHWTPNRRIIIVVVAGIAVLLAVIVGMSRRTDVRIAEYGPQGMTSGSEPISVRFSEAMAPASVADHFRIDPPVTGDITWTSSKVLRFTPRQPWQAGQTYTVTLERGAQASQHSGTLHTPLSWTFTIRLPRAVYLAPTDKLARNLYLADLQTGETVPLTAAAYGVEDFAISPDGTEIAFSQNNPDGTADLWVLNLNDHAPRQITNCVEARCTTPAWKPDGTQIAYQRNDFNTDGDSVSRAWIVDLTSLETQLLFADSQLLGSAPAWSPTGQQVAVYDTAAAGIRVYDYAAGSDVLITSLVGTAGHWSPDGKKLAYPEVTRGSLGSEFYTTLEITDFTTMARAAVSDPDGTPVDDGEGVWSPDGQQLLVTRRYLDDRFTPGKQLYLLDPETGEAQPLVVDAAYYHAGARWDPTGERIIFQRFPLHQPAAHPSVWTFDLRTGELKQVAENAMLPQWLPVSDAGDSSPPVEVAVYPSPPPVTFVAPTPLPTLPPTVTVTETPVLDEPLPDLTLSILDGASIRLADLKGQIVFLNFWATWCVPCQEEMPALQALQDEHGADGVRVIAVTDPTAGQTEADIRSFLKTYDLTLTVALSSDAAFFQQFGVAQIPMTYIIDRAGIIRYRQLGALEPEDIAAYLQQLAD